MRKIPCSCQSGTPCSARKFRSRYMVRRLTLKWWDRSVTRIPPGLSSSISSSWRRRAVRVLRRSMSPLIKQTFCLFYHRTVTGSVTKSEIKNEHLHQKMLTDRIILYLLLSNYRMLDSISFYDLGVVFVSETESDFSSPENESLKERIPFPTSP